MNSLCSVLLACSEEERLKQLRLQRNEAERPTGTRAEAEQTDASARRAREVIREVHDPLRRRGLPRALRSSEDSKHKLRKLQLLRMTATTVLHK